jgi:hypothetical protein
MARRTAERPGTSLGESEIKQRLSDRKQKWPLYDCLLQDIFNLPAL